MMNIKNFISLYFVKAVRKLQRLFGFSTQYNYQPLYNYFHYVGRRPDKLALLSYRVLQLREMSRHTWSYGGDVNDIIHVLSQLGYKTDVVHPEDEVFKPDKSYDLVIAHPGKNIKKLFTSVSRDTIKILFLCGAYTKFQNSEEQKRIEELQKKCGTLSLHAERQISGDLQHEDFALRHADGVILLSNVRGAFTYPYPQQIFHLEGASFTDYRHILKLEKKDFIDGKDNFLFLSGSGNIHKGLGLLLESFRTMPDKTLYICTKLEDDFANVFEKELFHTSNICYIGYIRLYSKKFYDLVMKCNYLIFPSVSEGSPGSVADCMVQGLIPLVSRAAHIDVDGLGYYIDPCTREEIQRLVREVSSHDGEWYKAKSEIIQKEANKRFSQELFRNTFKKYIQDIISNV